MTWDRLWSIFDPKRRVSTLIAFESNSSKVEQDL